MHWDECATRAVGLSLAEVADRPLRTFSGGEQKRLALEVLLRGEADVLLLDEPDNFLDVPAKRWLEGELVASRKTVLYVSHDRELLAATATKIVTVEADRRMDPRRRLRRLRRGPRRPTSTSSSTDRVALRRRARPARGAGGRDAPAGQDLRRRSPRSSRRPRAGCASSSRRTSGPSTCASSGSTMRLGGARTGRRALVVEQLELDGLTDPFDLEVDFGERVAVLGGNGAGKSHFLRLLAGDDDRRAPRHVPPRRRRRAGLFHQTHEHPEWRGTTLLEILHAHDVVRGPAMAMLRRYEIQRLRRPAVRDAVGRPAGPLPDPAARASGATMLLLDEPTDNLDLVSAEALEAGLAEFTGTVDRRHPRPLVPARLRPLRRVRRRLHRHRPPGGPRRLGPRPPDRARSRRSGTGRQYDRRRHRPCVDEGLDLLDRLLAGDPPRQQAVGHRRTAGSGTTCRRRRTGAVASASSASTGHCQSISTSQSLGG